MNSPRDKELIQAGIDGELSSEEQGALEKLLEESAEARALDAELRALGAVLAEETDPEYPSQLHEDLVDTAAVALANAVPPVTPRRGRAPAVGGPAWAGAPAAGRPAWASALVALRYVGAFAAGLLVTAVLYELGTPPPTEDFSGLAGSMLSSDALTTSSVDGFEVQAEGLSGRVDLRQGRTVLVVDFELDSAGPVEVTLSYGEEGLGFGGFAQVENELSDVQVANGLIRLVNEGQHRFAVFFRDSGEEAGRITLSFRASGELIHEETLTAGQ